MPTLGIQLSLTVRFTLGASPPAPPNATQLPIEWEDNSETELGYRVKWELTAGGSQTTYDLAPNTTEYTITGLSYNTQYDVEVVAFNGVGESNTLGPVSLYTPPPSAPTGCGAVATGDTTATVSWTLPGTEPVTGYRVYRSPAGAGTWTAAGVVAAGATSLGVTGLIPSTAYDFHVRGYNSNAAESQPDSETAASNAASATTPASPLSYSDVFGSGAQNPIAGNWETNLGNQADVAQDAYSSAYGTGTGGVGTTTAVARVKVSTAAFTPNHFAQFTFAASGGTSGPACRVQSDGSCYVLRYNAGSTAWEIVKRINAPLTITAIGATLAGTALANGVVARLKATTSGGDCVLEGFINGVSIGSRSDTTSVLAGGQPGMCLSNTAEVQNFSSADA